MASRYLRKAEVARRYSCALVTVSWWVKTGRLPRPIYRGGNGRPIWSLDELEAYDRKLKRPRGISQRPERHNHALLSRSCNSRPPSAADLLY